MATNTSGGTTASFSNTPQAQGDTFYEWEDILSTWYFDVMSNDLGGNAKILWSVDDGTNSTSSTLAGSDLLVQDTVRVEATSSDTSKNGARIWITSDGKVAYDATTLSSAFKSSIQALSLGETLTDTFIYAIRLSNGTLSWTTVTVLYQGQNDGVAMAATAQGGVTEDVALSSSGTASFADPDVHDHHTATFAADPSNSTHLGTFAIGPVSESGGNGSVGWTYQLDNNAAQYLGANDVVYEKYVITVSDGHGGTALQTVTVAIHGTNDGPVAVAGGQLSAAVQEDVAVAADGKLHGSGSFGFTDVDLSDSHSVSVTPAAAGYVGVLTPTVSHDSTGGGTGQVSWNFAVDNAAVQFLAAGQVLTQTYTVTVDDGHGGTAAQTVTVTITGTNDAPDISVASGDSASATLAETNLPLSASGTLTVVDPDTSDNAALSVSGFSKSGNSGSLTDAQLQAMLSLGASSLAADSGSTHNLGWSFNSGAEAFDYLAAGESLTLNYTVTANDGHGGTDAQTITITVTGTNDVVSVTSASATGTVVEDSAATPSLTDSNIASGTIAFTDADLSDNHSASFAVDPTNTTALGAFALGSVSEAANAASGSVGWSYTINETAAQYLAAGQSVTENYIVTLDDDHGSTTTQTVTVTITGTNDAPEISVLAGDSASASLNETNSPLTASGTLTVVDPDTSDTVALSVTGLSKSGDAGSLTDAQLQAMLSLGASSVAADSGDTHNLGWSFNSGAEVFDYLAAGESLTLTYTVTANDGHGGTDAQTVTLTVTGTNDDPVLTVDAAGAVTEDASNSNLTDTGTLSFTDVDVNDTHSVSASYNGDASWSGGGSLSPAQVTALTSGFSADSDSWDYSLANAAVDFLAQGETITLSFDVTVIDNHGGSDTKTVTLTVTGTNDDPVLTIDAAGAVTEDASNPNLTDTGTLSFTDVDVNDTHSVSASYNGDASWSSGGSLSPAQVTALTSGFTADSDSWDYSLANAAVDFLAQGETITLSFDVTVSDNHGGSDTKTVTLTVTGTNDVVSVTSASATGTVVEDSAATPSLTDSNVANGTISFTDADLSDSHSASFAADPTNTTALGAFALGSVSEAANAASGSVGWTYTISETAAQYLAAGQSVTENYIVTLNDGHGSTTTQTVTVTITGTNDAPEISVLAGDSVSAGIDESNAGLIASGTITVNDADLSDTVSTSVSLTGVTGNQGSLTSAQLEAMLSASPASSLAANTGDSNNLTWTFDSGSEAFNYLAAGDSLQLTYMLTVDDGHGGSATQAVTVTITGTNDAPVLTGDRAAVVAEGGTYVLTGADLGFTDPDDSAANVTFSASGVTNGTLLVNGIAATSFTGQQLADGLVSFVHDGSETTSATFNVAVEDGNEDGSAPVAQAFTFTVTPVNDAPVNTLQASYATNEDTPLKLTGLSVSDADAGSGTISVTLAVSGGTITAADGGGVTVAGSGTNSVQLSGTLADINAYLAAAASQPSFVPTANSTAGVTLTMTTSDNGNSGAGGALGDSDTRSISITSVNDAPAGSDGSVTTAEDTAKTLSASDFGFSDANDSPANAFAAVTITTLPASGILTLNGSAVTAGQSVSVGDINSGLLIYTPAANVNGSTSFTFQVQDDGGIANGGVDLDQSANTLTINITAVNDAPVATIAPTAISATEGVALDLKTNGLSISDVDANGGSVTVTLSVGEGTLNATAGDSGAGVSGSGTSSLTITGTVSQVNAFLGAVGSSSTLSYVDGSDTPAASTTLTLSVHDNGNSGAGGDLSSSDTATININAVNDAPVNVIPASFTTNEDTPLKLAGLSVNDVDAGSGSISVTLSVGSGTLSAANAGGVTVTGSGTGSIVLSGSQADIDAYLASSANQPTYTPVANANGAVSLTMTTSDNGNSGSGGAQTDTDLSTINVTSVNDAPAGTSGSVTTLEDTAKALSASDFGFTDPNDSPANAFAAVMITTLPGSGTLTLNGSAVTAGQSVSVADINAGLLVYTPASNVNGSASFTFQVQDDGGTANSGVDLDQSANTLTVNITAVNDAPALTGSAAALPNGTEDSAYTVTKAQLLQGWTDVDADTLSVTGLTASNGIVTDNGDGTYTITQVANFNGAVTLNYNVTDGTAPVAASLGYTVNAVNDPPASQVPGTQTISEDGSLTFSQGNGNPIKVGDTDLNAGNLTVTLSVAHGTLSLSGLSGLAFSNGDGTSDATMTFSGTQSAINAAMQGLVYTPTADFNGSDTLTIVSNDNGNSGTGGPLSDSDSVTINVSAVADIVADSVSVNANSGPNNLNLLGNDTFENAGRFISAVGAAGHGTVSINNNGTAGDLTDDFVVYTPNAGYSGADSFTYTVTSGGVTEQATVTVAVNAVDAQSPTDILFNLNPASSGFTGNNLGSGSLLGSFTSVDADSSTWTFTLGGTNASLFSLSPSGSQSSENRAAASTIASGNYTFTVTATDPGGHSFTETYHVGVGTSGADTAAVFTVTTGTDVDFGLNGQDVINGGAGDDALVGGQNDDQITGGAGADQLIGGQGNDTFVYTATSDSTSANRDTIFDFEEAGAGDVINLSGIDANLSSGGDQAFAFAGQTNAVLNNSVTWFQDAAHNTTIIQADNNGDGIADLVIVLTGLHTLTGGDFGL
jgi:VCBS repeat-containing protein